MVSKVALVSITILLIFLIWLITFQPGEAAEPRINIDRASTQLGALSNPGNIAISAQSSITVTFNYKGTEDDDIIRSFRCSLNGSPHSCPSVMNDPTSRPISTTSPETRNKIGAVNLENLRAGDYTFSVIAVNNRPISSPINERESRPETWTFAIRENPIVPSWTLQELCGDGIDNNGNGQTDEDPCPRLRIQVNDPNGNDVTFRTTPFTSVFTFYEARSQALSTYCDTGILNGLPSKHMVYERQFFKNCVNISDMPIRQYYAGPTFGYSFQGPPLRMGTYSYCGVVFDTSERRSEVQCVYWRIVPNTTPPPITQIGKTVVGGPAAVQPYTDLRSGGITVHDNIILYLKAVPPPFRVALPFEEAYFDCGWDSPDLRQCGTRVNAHNAFVSLDNIGDGNHYLIVRARYSGSNSGPEVIFRWCVISTTNPCHNPLSPATHPIYRMMSLNGMMYPGGAGVNESFIIPDAGFNKIVIENEKANLSGAAFEVNPGYQGYNNTKFADTKSFSWKQVDGPNVILNSTRAQNVEFVAPSVENDTLLKFNFTVNDPKGISTTDTTNVLVVTKENAQKYKGNFCDAMVTNGIYYSNNVTVDGKENNGNRTDTVSMEFGKKYLNECETSLHQNIKQLGNKTELFPNLNLDGILGNVTSRTIQEPR